MLEVNSYNIYCQGSVEMSICEKGLSHSGKMGLLFTGMKMIHILTSPEFDEMHVIKLIYFYRKICSERDCNAFNASNMSSPFSVRWDFFSVGFLRRREGLSPAWISCERLLSRLS